MEKRFSQLGSVELRAVPATQAEDGDQLVRGYAIVFNSESVDLGGFTEIVTPGSLDRSLAEVADGTRSVYAFWAHDSSQPIASTGSGTLRLYRDEKGLRFEMSPDRLNPMQHAALAAGDMRVSFGFSVRKDSWEDRGEGPVLRTLIDIDLFEISPVVSPAYEATDASLRSFEAWKATRETVTEAVVEIVPDASTEEPEVNASNAYRSDLLAKLLSARVRK